MTSSDNLRFSYSPYLLSLIDKLNCIRDRIELSIIFLSLSFSISSKNIALAYLDRISIKNIALAYSIKLKLYLLSLAIIEPIIGYNSLLGYIGSNQRRRFRRDIVYVVFLILTSVRSLFSLTSVVLILFSVSILSSFFSGCFSDQDYLPSFSEKRITGSLGRC